MDLSFIRTIVTHTAAVHGIAVSAEEARPARDDPNRPLRPVVFIAGRWAIKHIEDCSSCLSPAAQGLARGKLAAPIVAITGEAPGSATMGANHRLYEVHFQSRRPGQNVAH
jgi:hypothetical protein